MTGQPDSPAGPSFERDVHPLFREKDRDSMLKAFDLWSVGKGWETRGVSGRT